jgi:hypothetical protein
VLGGSLAGLLASLPKTTWKVNKAPWLMATGEDYRYRERMEQVRA